MYTRRLLEYREGDGVQVLELTTMELDEEHVGSTDLTDILADGEGEQVDQGVTIAHISVLGKSEIYKVIENKLSPKISHLSAEYKNDDFGCCDMDWKSPSIVNVRREDFRDMEEMIAFWEELEIVDNTPVVEQVARKG